jgi:AraC family transcriptional regulator, transcriptional activator of pobA
MDKQEFIIPTFDPGMLESKLFRSGGDVFQPFIHTFSMVFHINRIEDYIRKVKVPSETDLHPYRLTVFQFMFLTEGRCIRSKGLSAYEFGKGTFFLVSPYEISTNEFMSEDARGFYCYFDLDLLSFDYKLKDLLSDFPFLNFNGNSVITVDGDSIDLILNLIIRLETEYKKEKECRSEVLKAYLMALFVELSPFVKSNPNASGDIDYRITEQFRKALAQHIYVNRKTEEYARMLKISPDRLNRCVKNITGKRASELIQDMILLESKVLLKQTSLSVSEITYKLGQNHISNFVRFFKSKTGMSPGEYRSSINP